MTDDTAFFVDDPISNSISNKSKRPLLSETRIKIFRHIERTQPTNAYRISRELKISYSVVHHALRDMIFAGLLKESVQYQQSGGQVNVITIAEVSS